MKPLPDAQLARRLTVTAVLLFALWAVLVEGDAVALAVGVPIVLLATAAGLLVFEPREHRGVALPLLRIAPRLAWLSLVSGFDVATRALRPSLPIDPDLVDYRLDEPDERIAVALAYAATVLPGTLAAEVEPERLRLHVIDRRQAPEETLRRLERGMRGRR